MTNQEILQKAISKAIDGSWDGKPDPWGDTSVFDLIFNHDFAKAFFGEYPTRIPAYSDALENWQYHLKLMVVAEDPITYLGENL